MENTAKLKEVRRDISKTNLKVINGYFNSDTFDIKTLINECSNLTLHEEIRPLAWRVFLGLIPYNDIKSWEPIIHECRCQYNTLKEDIISKNIAEFICSKAKKGTKEFDNFAETLTKKDFSLLSMIKLDLNRTFHELPFFNQNSIMQSLANILFIYCKHNDKLGYQQGMNEIIGTLAYVLQPNTLIAEEAVGSTRSFLFFMIYHNDFFETDLYFMFNELMSRGLNELFNYNISSISDGSLGNIPLEQRNLLTLANIMSSRDSELRKRIYKLFYIDLKSINKKVYNLLSPLIDPVVFLLRWILCLLNREFEIEKVPKLWDTILAYEFVEYSLKKNIKHKGSFLIFVDYLSLAMICLLEKRLFEDSSDDINLHSILMNYPNDISTDKIIAKAIKISEKLNNGNNYFKIKL